MSPGLIAVIQKLLRVRMGELQRTALAFAYLFAVVSSFIIARIARTVLFLEIPGYRAQLPWTYLAVAAVMSLVMFGYARVERALRRDKTNSITLAILIVITLAFRLALLQPSHAVYWAYYVWVEVFGTIMIVQFWSFANEIFHARQAKRLFAVIGGGGTAANIAVGLMISRYVEKLGTENLLYVICACLLLALTTVVALGKQARAELSSALERAPSSARKKSANTKPTSSLASRHVRLIGAVIVLIYFVSTVVDYQFNVVVADAIPGKDARSAYLGSFFSITGILGLVVQLVITGRLLERFGVRPALLILPSLIALGTTGGLTAALTTLLPALWAISFTKGAENVIRYTINDSTLQLLYLPVPSHIRGRVKAFTDGLLKPVAVGLAGILLTALTAPWGLTPGAGSAKAGITVYLGGIVILAIVAWLIAVVHLHREYLASLMLTLKNRRLNFADAKFQINDEATLKTLEKALFSDRVGDILNALELADAAHGHQRMATPVKRLLLHPAPEIRVAALEFLGETAALDATTLEPLLKDAAATVRSAASLATAKRFGDKAIATLSALLEDPELSVRAATIAGLLRHGGLDGMLSCADILKRLLSSTVAHEREQAAWILGEVGVENFYQPLLPLLNDPDDTVRRAAATAAGRLRNEALLEPLLAQLARPRVVNAAITALAAYGPKVVQALSAALNAPQKPPAAARSNMCRLLARIDDAEGADLALLAALLGDATGSVRSSAIASLRSIIHQRPSAHLPADLLSQALHREAALWYHMLLLSHDLKLPAKDATLLQDALVHRQKVAMERILGLLDIKYPAAGMEWVAQHINSSQAAPRANAVELLDNTLDKEEKAYLIAMVDDAQEAKRLPLAVHMFGGARHEKPAGALNELLRSDDSWLRTCAAYTAACWGLTDLASPISGLLQSDDPLCRETASIALKRLGRDDANAPLPPSA